MLNFVLMWFTTTIGFFILPWVLGSFFGILFLPIVYLKPPPQGRQIPSFCKLVAFYVGVCLISNLIVAFVMGFTVPDPSPLIWLAGGVLAGAITIVSLWFVHGPILCAPVAGEHETSSPTPAKPPPSEGPPNE